MIPELRDAPCGWQPDKIEAVLDGDRQPVQRPPILTFGERAVSGLGAPSCAGNVHGDDRVDAGIMLLDACQIQIEQFLRADFLFLDERRQLRGRTKRNAVHCSCPASTLPASILVPSLM